MQAMLTTGAAFLGLVFFNMVFYLSLRFYRLLPDCRHLLFVHAVVFLVATAVSAAAISWLIAVLRRGAGGSGRNLALSRAAAGLLVAAVTLHAGVRLFGFEAWLASGTLRLFGVVSFSITGALAYALFFLRVPERRRGVLFGLAVAAGMAAKLVAVHVLEAEPGLAGLYSAGAVYQWEIWCSVALAAALAAGCLLAAASPRRAAPAGAAGGNASRNRMALLLAAAAAAFCVLNGFLPARLFSIEGAEAARSLCGLPLLIMAYCVLAGWLIDRDPGFWLGWLPPFSALALLFSPALGLLGEHPVAYMIVHAFFAFGQYTFFMCASLALGRIAREGFSLWCLLVFGPYTVRILSMPGAIFVNMFPEPIAGLMFAGSVVSVAVLYHLIRRIDFFRAAAPDAAPAPPPAADDVDELFARHGLTARESAVARELARGHTSGGIAERLNISENTVNTHVKRILRKFNLASRKALVVRLAGGTAADAGDEGRET